jgi:hypothetical protein
MTGIIDGPCVDVLAHSDIDGVDHLRTFYPTQGINRPDTPLVYGVSVANFSRSLNSADYANYVRVIGQNPDTTVGVPQLYAEAISGDANDVTRIAVGLWMRSENASDVNQQATLNEKANGSLRDRSVLVPSYSLGLRPGWFRPGFPNMGDTVPLRIEIGRLDVDTTVRVVGIDYAIGDDGQEDVTLTAGRPALTLSSLFVETRRDINALARR